jgi:hypothetical protein
MAEAFKRKTSPVPGGARTTPPRELEAIVCVCATTIPISELCREILADGAIRPGRSIPSSTDDHRRDRACRGIVSGGSETRAWLGPSRQARLGQSGSALGLVQAPVEASRLGLKLSQSAHFPFRFWAALLPIRLPNAQISCSLQPAEQAQARHSQQRC